MSKYNGNLQLNVERNNHAKLSFITPFSSFRSSYLKTNAIPLLTNSNISPIVICYIEIIIPYYHVPKDNTVYYIMIIFYYYYIIIILYYYQSSSWPRC